MTRQLASNTSKLIQSKCSDVFRYVRALLSAPVKGFTVQSVIINRFEPRYQITFEGSPGSIRGVFIRIIPICCILNKWEAYKFVSGLLIDNASQTKVHIYRMHKTVNSVTIHAIMKARWFFHLYLLKKALCTCKLRF